jgi:hypothetical protein
MFEMLLMLLKNQRCETVELALLFYADARPPDADLGCVCFTRNIRNIA